MHICFVVLFWFCFFFKTSLGVFLPFSKVSVPKMACSKSGSTNFNHAAASDMNTQISFNTTTATPWFKIHSFPKGLYKVSVYIPTCLLGPAGCAA